DGIRDFHVTGVQTCALPILKVAGYNESVNLNATNAVTADLQFLAAKVARLANPTHPRHAMYVGACERIIGFVPSAVASPNGQKPDRKSVVEGKRVECGAQRV